ncbi:MAG TPA: hypothetical protein VF658_06960 [Pyrinomonadaceae bacterium]|jgi:hypothetical protein
MKAKAITAETNRGVLLDVFVFIINLALMNLLMRYSLDLLRSAGEGDAFAVLALVLCSGGMFVLPAVGAVLKRWHFHRRLSARPKSEGEATKLPFDLLELKSNVAAGCLFNPIFYLVLSIFLSSVVLSLVIPLIFGKRANTGAVFVPLVIASFVTCVVQTVLVYRYFSPPKKAPSAPFLRDPASEQVGDLCICVNMILFQVFWNLVISQFPFTRAASAGEFAFNLFVLVFLALLVYFPPRIFYLAEDIRRPATWLTILLANSPTILRALFGGDANARGLIP